MDNSSKSGVNSNDHVKIVGLSLLDNGQNYYDFQ